MAGVRAFEQGRFAAAAKQFGLIQENDENDAFLAYAEIGMAWHVAGQPEQAIQTWLLADKKLKSFGDRPTISGRSITEAMGSFILNDKALPYDGEDFEIALLHGMLAWDYLRLGELDGAMVEVFRGYQVQKNAEEKFGAQYEMNRFARFVSAVVQEVDANFDEAEIDLKQLEKESPGHPAIQYSLDRILRLQSTAGAEERKLAQLIAVHEVSIMPRKIAVDRHYSTKRSQGRVSLPKFGFPPKQNLGVTVHLDQNPLGSTVLIENVLQVARKNLNDRIGWVVAKSIGRAAAKSILIDKTVKKVKKKHGDGAGFLAALLGSALHLATERADLRSWITLPQSIEVFRAPIAPGDHNISIQIRGGEIIPLGIHSFEPGHPVLITVRTLRNRAYAQVGPLATTPAL